MFTSLPMCDESAMNLEGVASLFSKFLLFAEAFCEWGANRAEPVTAPSVGTEEATSGRTYGLLGLQGILRQEPPGVCVLLDWQ